MQKILLTLALSAAHWTPAAAQAIPQIDTVALNLGPTVPISIETRGGTIVKAVLQDAWGVVWLVNPARPGSQGFVTASPYCVEPAITVFTGSHPKLAVVVAHVAVNDAKVLMLVDVDASDGKLPFVPVDTAFKICR